MSSPELIRAMAQAMLASPASTPTPDGANKGLMPGQASQEALAAPAANSPLSNELEAKVEPGVVTGQQQALQRDQVARQQAVDQSQFGLMPVDQNIPTDTAVLGPNGEPMNADALMADNVRARDASLNANNSVAGSAAHAAREQNAVDLQIQKASQPAEDQLHDRMTEGYNDLHNTALEVDEQSKAAIVNYSGMQDQMRTMALQKPQDLFGAAGINRVLGSVAIFLGGAGTNGQHANAALAQINNLADRNIAAQKQRFEMLEHTGEGDKTLYGMLQNRLQNKVAVESTMRNAALEAYKGELRRAANQYAGPAAKAALDTQLSKIGDTQNQNNQVAAQSYIKNGEGILQIRGMENAQKVAAQANALKNNAMVSENAIDGVLGYVPKSSHERLSKMTAGARTMVAMTNHIEDMIRGGADLGTIREYMVANAVQFKGARDFLETGTRIEEGEQRIIDQLNPAAKESLFSAAASKLFKSDPSALLDKLDAIRATVTETAYMGIHTAAPHTTAFDRNDPLWGKYAPGEYKSLAQRKLEKMNGNPAGRGTIDSLKAYAPGSN